jgi:hypothetical protein
MVTGHDQDEVIAMFKKAIEESGLTVYKWARLHGLNEGHLYGVLKGTVKPMPYVLEHLGLKRAVVYITKPPYPRREPYLKPGLKK